MVKARYRRGLARKESGQYRAALIGTSLLDSAVSRLITLLDPDFQTVLEQDSTRVEARDRITETQFFYDKYGDDEFWDDANTGVLSYGWPYVDDEPMDVSDTESDSTDCNHIGNGVPCRFYNHGGCSRKDTCRYSHAPDNLSERDELYVVLLFLSSFVLQTSLGVGTYASIPCWIHANSARQNAFTHMTGLFFLTDGGTIQNRWL